MLRVAALMALKCLLIAPLGFRVGLQNLHDCKEVRNKQNRVCRYTPIANNPYSYGYEYETRVLYQSPTVPYAVPVGR